MHQLYISLHNTAALWVGVVPQSLHFISVRLWLVTELTTNSTSSCHVPQVSPLFLSLSPLSHTLDPRSPGKFFYSRGCLFAPGHSAPGGKFASDHVFPFDRGNSRTASEIYIYILHCFCGFYTRTTQNAEQTLSCSTTDLNCETLGGTAIVE